MNPMAQIEAGGADRGRWNRSSPVARIADEHGDGIRALMAVNGGESHLTEHDRLAYRPADHSKTINNARSKTCSDDRKVSEDEPPACSI
jgi:hypothetical protein